MDTTTIGLLYSGVTLVLLFGFQGGQIIDRAPFLGHADQQGFG